MSNNPIAVISGDILATKGEFQAVLSDTAINFEREAEFAIQVLSNSDYALKIALENRQSVVNAVKNLAAIGISLNPAKKQAYLVPRNRAICLDISYMGLLDLAVASGSVRWGHAEVVREKDVFRLNGFDKAPTHEFDPFDKDRGDLKGAYVVVKTADGDYLTTAMPIDEIFAIRDRSEAWKSFIAKKSRSCPWATDEGEMVKKTVIKRAYKTWPKTDRLDSAIHHLNTDGGEGLVDINEPPAPQPAVLHPLSAKAFEKARVAVGKGEWTLADIDAAYALTAEQRDELKAAELEAGK